MLHHIVFLNQGRPDQSCDIDDGIWRLRQPPDGAGRRALLRRGRGARQARDARRLRLRHGREAGRRRLRRQPLVGALHGHEPQGRDRLRLHRVQGHLHPGHRAAGPTQEGTDSQQDAVPFWMDAENCRADPIYNIPGTGTDDGRRTDENVTDFTVDQEKLGATGGPDHRRRRPRPRRRLRARGEPAAVRRPDPGRRHCRPGATPDHPFYNVQADPPRARPDQHDARSRPSRASRSRAASRCGCSSVYDDTRPHTRVMGIMIIFIAPDSTVPADPCSAPLPTDVITRAASRTGRTGEPPEFKVPLTGLDEQRAGGQDREAAGQDRGREVGHDDRRRGQRLLRSGTSGSTRATSSTGASTPPRDSTTSPSRTGPKAIGSPNLSRDGEGTPAHLQPPVQPQPAPTACSARSIPCR